MDRMAQLREHLLQPTIESWQMISSLLESCAEPDEYQMTLVYIKEHLNNWPTAMRWQLTNQQLTQDLEYEQALVDLAWQSEEWLCLEGDHLRFGSLGNREFRVVEEGSLECCQSQKRYAFRNEPKEPLLNEEDATIHQDVIYSSDVLSSPLLEGLESEHLTRQITEIYQHDFLVPETLHQALNTTIDAIVEEVPADIHPGSHGVADDIIHPSLYPLVCEDSTPGTGGTDRWGRPIEDHTYQWLPSEVQVTEGEARFTSRINNMPKSSIDAMFEQQLEALLQLCIKPLNVTWNHALKESYEGAFTGTSTGEEEEVDFTGMTLQVIPKVVEFTLQPGQVYQGVWHVEGMSRENIVATAIYFLKRDISLSGGELQFKRFFNDVEEEELIVELGMPQLRSSMIDQKVSDYKPLGQTETREGRLICFPNSHAHRLLPLTNTGNEPARRRIVTFFLVNPNIRIPSTQDIPPEAIELPLEEAKLQREGLMEERSLYKGTLNPREIHLCEH